VVGNNWQTWLGLVVCYILVILIVWAVSARAMCRRALAKRNNEGYSEARLPSHVKDDILFKTFWIGLFWPVAAIATALLSWALADPNPPDPTKIEGKKDWVEGYEDDDSHLNY
jgi:hypothetical protein